VKNQRTFDDYCKSNQIVKNQVDRNEMSEKKKESVKMMMGPPSSYSKSLGRPIVRKQENVSLHPLNNSLNPFG